MKENKGLSKIEQLKERLEECKAELLSILDAWCALYYIEKPQLVFSYETIFGKLETELHSKNLTIREINRKVELISQKIDKGEQLSSRALNFIDIVVGRESELHKKRMRASQKMTSHIGFCEVNVNYEIPQLYRQLVKNIHPDVSDESVSKHWNNVQYTYKDKDLKRMRLFHQVICSPETSFPNQNLEEISLKTQINQLELNIRREKRLIEELQSNEPFSIKEDMKNKVWIAKRRRKLHDKLFKIEQNISKQTKLLKAITKDTSSVNLKPRIANVN